MIPRHRTMRKADREDSPAEISFIYAQAVLRFDGESTSRPIATNVNR
jgi:hypothetical protein